MILSTNKIMVMTCAREVKGNVVGEPKGNWLMNLNGWNTVTSGGFGFRDGCFFELCMCDVCGFFKVL